jgi:asparagine synthase (glutamine-hydrolysing)
MCGIAGVVALDDRQIAPGTAARMRDRILHRGPDGSAEFEAPGVSLAACRLAIVDLDPRGLMPMSSADGRYRIVHNGEIYNRLELRQQLIEQGVALRTTTDTEVIVELWRRQGEAMLDRLDGMFAFAIWDTQTRELFAARDRCGEKPFFWSVHRGCLWFGSEPKALFAGGVPCTFDEATWPELLVFRFVAGSRTPYAGVQRLEPGQWLRAGPSGLVFGRWWNFPTDHVAGNGAAVGSERPGRPDARALGSMLAASVERRLIADVPVGTLLSGGLDSSSVTALAAAAAGRPLPAFTVRYDDAEADEGEFAAAAARAAGVEHHEVRVDAAERPALIADAAWHQDEPLVFGPSPELLAVSRYARRHVRVLLTGESSDELFGGYRWMQPLHRRRLARPLGALLAPVAHLLPRGSRAWWIATAARRGRPAEWLPLINSARPAHTVTAAPLADWAPWRAELAERARREYREPVRQALAYERMTHLPAVLDHCDRQTMGAAIESRLPFLDPDVLRIAALARPEELFRGREGKQLLRQAMVGRLPDQILQRRKQGWTSPYQRYLREIPELSAWLARVPDHEIVTASPIGRDAARDAVERFLAGDPASASLAWALGRVVLWHEVCVEGVRQPFAVGPARGGT